MGKAKRFNSYDAPIAERRKVIQGYGEQRQKLSRPDNQHSGN
jgi:hypothetical protein